MDRRSFLKTCGIGIGSLVAAPVLGADTATTDKSPDADKAATRFRPGSKSKILIAHRGASAYAPENTLPAYKLAIEQGSTFVEQDLHITKDGVLVCIHDGSLNATTNVEEVFPDRFTMETVRGKQVKAWMVNDFTLAEIKQLTAGFRDDREFASTTIPTWQEAIEEIRGKAGLCPETKSEAFYKKRGFEMEKLVAEVLRKNGLDKRDADSRTPVLMQSFSKESIQRLGANGIELPTIWLQSKGSKDLQANIAEAHNLGYAGIGPYKDDISREYAESAREAGLMVIPYTYDPGTVKSGYANVTAEMRNHLYELGIDGLFTNNPDLFPFKA